MSDAMTAVPEPPRFSSSMATDPAFAARLTRAQLGSILFRPSRIVAWALLLGVLLVVAVANALDAEPAWPALVFIAAVIVVTALPWAIGYPVAVRSVRKQLPTGSIYSLELRADTFEVKTPLIRTETAYSLYISCRRSGSFVVLRLRAGRAQRLLPIELFTDESFAYLESRIQPPAPD